MLFACIYPSNSSKSPLIWRTPKFNVRELNERSKKHEITHRTKCIYGRYFSTYLLLVFDVSMPQGSSPVVHKQQQPYVPHVFYHTMVVDYKIHALISSSNSTTIVDTAV